MAKKLAKEERDAMLLKKHSRSSLVSARKEVREIKLSRFNSRKSSQGVADNASKKDIFLVVCSEERRTQL